jgi:hypothetical protein
MKAGVLGWFSEVIMVNLRDYAQILVLMTDNIMSNERYPPISLAN